MPAPSGTQATPRQLYAAGHFARTLIWSFSDLALAYYLHARQPVLHISRLGGSAVAVGAALLPIHQLGAEGIG